MAKRGVVVVVGNRGPCTDPPGVNFRTAMMTECSIVGCMLGGATASERSDALQGETATRANEQPTCSLSYNRLVGRFIACPGRGIVHAKRLVSLF